MATPTLREAAQALSDETGDAKRGGVYHVDYRDMMKLHAALAAEDEREAAIAGLVKALQVLHEAVSGFYVGNKAPELHGQVVRALEAARKAGLVRP